MIPTSKQSLLYDVQNLDEEIIEKGIDIAKSFHQVRKASELLQRWVKEAEKESKENATTTNTISAGSSNKA